MSYSLIQAPPGLTGMLLIFKSVNRSLMLRKGAGPHFMPSKWDLSGKDLSGLFLFTFFFTLLDTGGS